MAKMHEILAVESAVTATFNTRLDETLKVLGKPEMFTQIVTEKRHFNADEASKLDTVETKAMTTTVANRLSWFAGPTAKYFDLILQRDRTNQKAVSDIVIDGVTIAAGVPATTLLMLESKLQEVRKVMEATPTLQAGIEWEYDTQSRHFNAKEPSKTFSTKKTAKAVVLYEATKEHPAQVKEVFEDIPVATVIRKTSSSMITSADKADMLTRLDLLLQAVKKARMRANEIEADKSTMGESIMNYLLGTK